MKYKETKVLGRTDLERGAFLNKRKSMHKSSDNSGKESWPKNKTVLIGGTQDKERENTLISYMILCIWHMQYQRGEGEAICTWAQRGMYTVNLYKHKEDNSQWTEGSVPLSDTSAGRLWEYAGE